MAGVAMVQIFILGLTRGCSPATVPHGKLLQPVPVIPSPEAPGWLCGRKGDRSPSPWAPGRCHPPPGHEGPLTSEPFAQDALQQLAEGSEVRRGVCAGPPILPQPQHPTCGEGSISTHGCPSWGWVCVGEYLWEQLCLQPQGGSLVLQEVPDTPAGCDPPRLPAATPHRNSGKLPQNRGQVRYRGGETPAQAAELALLRQPPARGDPTRPGPARPTPSVRPNRCSKGPGPGARATGGGRYRSRGATLTFKGAQQRLLPGHGLVPPPWGGPAAAAAGREPGTGKGPGPAPGAEQPGPAGV